MVMRSGDQKEGRWRCRLCWEEFLSFEDLRRHVAVEEDRLYDLLPVEVGNSVDN